MNVKGGLLGLWREERRWRGKMGAMTDDARVHPVFELNEAGIAIMRMNLRRRNPAASEAEIDALLLAWVRDRPGAPLGDADGVPSKRFS